MENGYYSIKEVCEILKLEAHNLRYIEKVLDLEIKRDEFLNRMYSQNDLEQLQMIIGLKDQGLNYNAIKKVIEHQEEVKEEAAEEARTDIIIQDKNLEKFMNLLTQVVSDSVEKAVSTKLEEFTNKIDELRKENTELHRRIETSIQTTQAQHFKDLDERLNRWREESKTEKKSLWGKLFRL